jgi:hypothetical protein
VYPLLAGTSSGKKDTMVSLRSAALVLVCLCTLLARPVRAAEAQPRTPLSLSLQLTGSPADGPEIAYRLTRTFMTDEQWKQYVSEFRRKFRNWEADTGGDMGRFLNDRLIIVALSAAGGEVDAIQRGMAYLALYREFNQIPPSIVTKFLTEHKDSAGRLLKDFTWGRASEYVKNRRWREDIAARKAKIAAEAEKMTATAQAKPPETAAAPAPPAAPLLMSPEAAVAGAPRVAVAEPRKATEVVATLQTYSAQSVGQPPVLSCLRLLAQDWHTLTAPATPEIPLTPE